MMDYAGHYQAEARQYRRPLVWNRWDDPAQIFDAHSNGKGAWVLHMLHRRLGDTLFWKVLEQHLATYAHKVLVRRGVEVQLETAIARASAPRVDLQDGSHIPTRTSRGNQVNKGAM